MGMTMTTDTREKLLVDISAWLLKNPYEPYVDYRDSFSADQVATLLESRQAFDESLDDWRFSHYDYPESWEYVESEMLDEFRERIFDLYRDELDDSIEEADELDMNNIPTDVESCYQENRMIDDSDAINQLFRNTQVNIVALVEKRNGEEVSPPHGDLESKENRKRLSYLKKTFDMDGWAVVSCYEHERLKVMGRLDLAEVYEKGKPVAITIGPESSLIFHTSWNGSGCLGDVVTKKTVTMKAEFRCDDHDRYGVQQVYGFVGEVWAGELDVAKWEPWA
jgi:hypothetical protein